VKHRRKSGVMSWSASSASNPIPNAENSPGIHPHQSALSAICINQKEDGKLPDPAKAFLFRRLTPGAAYK